MTDVVVIGAGVVGLSCAYSIRCRGLDVTVVEREAPGAGASWGNTGWITPALSTPLARPDVRGASLGWLLSRRGPLTIRPWKDPELPSWLWRFWRSCNAGEYAAGLAALAALNERTGELFDALVADGVDMELECRGMLLACRTSRTLERARRDIEFTVARPGVNVRVLDREGMREAEPALRDVRGGLLIGTDRYVRAETLAAGLLARLRSMGVRFAFGEEIVCLERRGGRVTHVVSDAGRRSAEAVVLAAGVWSGRLAQRLGFRLPMQAGKGYSVTVRRPQRALHRPVYLAEAKVALSPYPDVLRVAGTMELVGFDTRVDRGRLARLGSAVQSFVPGWEAGEAVEVWAGLRPLTPDGLPAIGRAPGFENLYVAAGHGMLGMTLAPATGEVLAALLAGGESPDAALDRFDPIRFN